jgi:hypothetical protein
MFSFARISGDLWLAGEAAVKAEHSVRYQVA